jgi:hypothetical protein
LPGEFHARFDLIVLPSTRRAAEKVLPDATRLFDSEFAVTVVQKFFSNVPAHLL